MNHSEAFGACTMSYNHHCYLVPECFHPPTRKLSAHEQPLPRPLSARLLATTDVLCLSGFAYLRCILMHNELDGAIPAKWSI